MRYSSLAGSLLVVLGWFTVAAAADNWPRFRGPNGTGVSPARLPVRWNEQDGLLWKVAVPGRGNSSPVIWGDHLFLQAATADGKERQLLCLDARSGKTLWTRGVPGAPATFQNQRNTLASSTPATDGERVYVVFWDGKALTMDAYDFRGERAWRRGLGGFEGDHGAGNSPIVHAGLVYLANDQDGAATLLALDAKTGQTAWEVKRRPWKTNYATPLLRDRPDGGQELIVVSTTGITGYDPKTGAEKWDYVWKFPRGLLRVVSSPIVHQGLLFATSGTGGGDRHMIAVNLDGDRPTLAWENSRLLPYVPGLLALGDHLYFVNDRGVAGCCKARTGAVAWSERLGGGFTASPLLADGKVYAVNDDGTVYVFAAALKFELLGRNPLGEPVSASPAAAGGRLYVRGQEHLFCIGTPARPTRPQP